MGVTKVFLKRDAISILNSALTLRRRAAAARVQACRRSCVLRRRLRAAVRAAVRIQAAVRGMIARHLARRIRQERAAVRLQSLVRSAAARRTFRRCVGALRTLQRWWKLRLCRIFLRRFARGCVILQRWWRRMRRRLEALRAQRGAVGVQRLWRGYQARRYAAKVRDGTSKSRYVFGRLLARWRSHVCDRIFSGIPPPAPGASLHHACNDEIHDEPEPQDAWAEENSVFLCELEFEQWYRQKLKFLSRRYVEDISVAVRYLNEGRAFGIEKENMCAVYSVSRHGFYVLHRPGRRAEAQEACQVKEEDVMAAVALRLHQDRAPPRPAGNDEAIDSYCAGGKTCPPTDGELLAVAAALRVRREALEVNTAMLRRDIDRLQAQVNEASRWATPGLAMRAICAIVGAICGDGMALRAIRAIVGAVCGDCGGVVATGSVEVVDAQSVERRQPQVGIVS